VVVADTPVGEGVTALVVMDGMVMEAHPLDLRGWWHRPHIPTRGEEARDGFLRGPRPPTIVVKHPQTSQ